MKRGQRISRVAQPDPEPTEMEKEILYLLSIGETLPDLAVKYRRHRHALGVRVDRMREMFGFDTTAQMTAEAVRRKWIE